MGGGGVSKHVCWVWVRESGSLRRPGLERVRRFYLKASAGHVHKSTGSRSPLDPDPAGFTWNINKDARDQPISG